MVEISTSILSVKKGEESQTFFALEKAHTDYFHIDVMDGKFVEKDTYKKIDERLIRGNVISNEDYSLAMNQKGEGVSIYKNKFINRFKSTDD